MLPRWRAGGATRVGGGRATIARVGKYSNQTCRVQGWLFETGCPLRKLKLKLKLKLVIVIRCSLVCSKTFSEDGTSSGRNRFRTMIFLQEYSFRKSSPKIRFSRSKFDFLQRLSNFQEIQENLLQRLPISKKPSSTAFRFLQRLSDSIIFQSLKIMHSN